MNTESIRRPVMTSKKSLGEDAFFVDPHSLGVADGVGCMAGKTQTRPSQHSFWIYDEVKTN